MKKTLATIGTLVLILAVAAVMQPRTAFAAIAHVDSTSGSATTGTALSCAKPTGTASGDVVVAIINSNGTRTITDNNGSTAFTKKTDLTYNSLSGRFLVWYRVAGASEPATYNFTGSASDRGSIVCATYSGVDATNPFDVDPNSATGSTANPSATGISTVTTGAFAVAVSGIDSNTITYSAYPADSFTMREDIGNQRMGMSDKSVSGTAPVSQGAVSWTLSAGNGWIASMFALKPAGGAPAVVAKQEDIVIFE